MFQKEDEGELSREKYIDLRAIWGIEKKNQGLDTVCIWYVDTEEWWKNLFAMFTKMVET